MGEHSLDPVTLEIYPGAEHPTYRPTLYEDDGETTGYRTGGWARTAFQLTVQTDGGTLEIGKARGQFSPQVLDRGYLIHFHHQAAVHAVLWNGTPLACLDAVHSLDLVEQGWQWQAATKVLTIKLPRTAEATIVHVR